MMPGMPSPHTPLPRARQVSLLGALYMAQGLPFGFFTLALPVLMRDAGWSLTAISLLQFLALPWALKFMWAPVLDHHGSRRMWLRLFLGSSCVMALVLSQLSLSSQTNMLFAAVLLFNLLAASQDVITDGLAVRLLDVRERGLANGLQVGGFRLGMILGGGVLLWVFARTDWETMFLCMAGLLALLAVPAWYPPEPVRALAPQACPRGMALSWAWLERALTPGMLTFAVLILAYRFGDQLLGSLTGPFMRDQGISKETIAMMKGMVGSGASLVGAFAGGWLTFRLGRRTALLFSGLTQALAFTCYVAAAAGWGGMNALWAATVLEGIFGTMATVALFTLMMDAADPAHAGTDFTLLACMTSLVSGLANLVGGVVADAFGYLPTFTLAAVSSALGCLVLVGWLDRHPIHPRIAQAWRG